MGAWKNRALGGTGRWQPAKATAGNGRCSRQVNGRVRNIVLTALALAPSAYLAWTWRAMPQLGILHDDAVYLVSAKSLAQGHGYRIESLPGQPFQTKYPPLLSIL